MFHRFWSEQQDDYFWVNFDHFYSERHILRPLGIHEHKGEGVCVCGLKATAHPPTHPHTQFFAVLMYAVEKIGWSLKLNHYKQI